MQDQKERGGLIQGREAIVGTLHKPRPPPLNQLVASQCTSRSWARWFLDPKHYFTSLSTLSRCLCFRLRCEGWFGSRS